MFGRVLVFLFMSVGIATVSVSDSFGAGGAELPAESRRELGVPVGAKIPTDFSTIRDRQGNIMTFDRLAANRGVAIFFVRSIDWCPFCKRQASDINKRAAEFEKRGVKPVFISYDTREKQTKFAARENFQLTILSDERSEVINAFGLLNESHAPGSRFYGIPHPAVFIVNPDGVVLAKLYEEDYASNSKSYRNRPEVEIILQEIDDVFAIGPANADGPANENQ